MSPIERMQIFHRVAELASFTQAAESLGLPKATASTAVQQLEAQLGVRLLHRTTRRVQLTQDGQAFYERSKDVLADVEELESMFQLQGAKGLSGRVRLDMTTGMARDLVIPRLPELLDRHPGLEIEFSSTERRVDLVREGFDCVLRVGAVLDNSLVARPLGLLRMANCASPAYLQAHGVPRTPADLAGHRLVHYVNTLGAKSSGFEYLQDGRAQQLAMAGAVTVNNADAYQAACLAGLGLIQVPVLVMTELLASGRLVEVMPDYPAPPMPLNMVYANRRHLSTRVRVVMDWLAEILGPHLQAAD
ncbi:LysR family transcriptional regulator [Paucibacter sp. O1-1]|uniref:LysR family transcriptional regulator n=1 Tax=Paucibacter sp. M5-1 TaxID=3015998 RepID=UPI0021D4AA6C|nr:LysR family transcriptional regulator [Paucibacter sp. M5-1]MCU7375517.1 LysR family transcriptional regulator [Paucibacter sp. O1-1]MCZ7884712.1 LysR family transcriptional regulator [Paucibacter sp. M5-1]MDA3830524.1 LysR family transcriptional regulator [Paucibacter sp. O1-1]